MRSSIVVIVARLVIFATMLFSFVHVYIEAHEDAHVVVCERVAGGNATVEIRWFGLDGGSTKCTENNVEAVTLNAWIDIIGYHGYAFMLGMFFIALFIILSKP